MAAPQAGIAFAVGSMCRPRPWLLVMPAAGKPIAVVPTIGAAYFASIWLDDIRTWPSPRPDGHTELRRGMVITLEPGLPWRDGKIMVHEEVVLIGENGPRFLTRRAAPKITRIGSRRTERFLQRYTP